METYYVKYAPITIANDNEPEFELLAKSSVDACRIAVQNMCWKPEEFDSDDAFMVSRRYMPSADDLPGDVEFVHVALVLPEI